MPLGVGVGAIVDESSPAQAARLSTAQAAATAGCRPPCEVLVRVEVLVPPQVPPQALVASKQGGCLAPKFTEHPGILRHLSPLYAGHPAVSFHLPTWVRYLPGRAGGASRQLRNVPTKYEYKYYVVAVPCLARDRVPLQVPLCRSRHPERLFTIPSIEISPPPGYLKLVRLAAGIDSFQPRPSSRVR